ncbi:glycoside hydrolase family 114 protein, partial [Acidomyces richmondensis BFW]
AWWQPPAGTTWDINLSGIFQPPYPANTTALDGDLYANTNASTWTAVRSANYKTICYFSAGSFENWRPDAGEFNKSTDIGAPLDGWNGEWWLNTNSPNVRRIMLQRLDLAQKQGCDAVDPDNVDAYDNGGGGFNLTAADAVNYVKFLAAEAHARGMGAGLKNAEAIIPHVLADVDFQVNEQCLQYQECGESRPFIDAGKPVFEIEYTKKNSDKPSKDSRWVQRICTAPSRNGFSTLIKHMNLGSWGIAC